MGLHDSACPIETQETIQETIRFRRKKSIRFSIQVSIGGALPPAPELYKQATANGWIDSGALLSGERHSGSRRFATVISPPDRDEDASSACTVGSYFPSGPSAFPARKMATDRQMLVRTAARGRRVLQLSARGVNRSFGPRHQTAPTGRR